MVRHANKTMNNFMFKVNYLFWYIVDGALDYIDVYIYTRSYSAQLYSGATQCFQLLYRLVLTIFRVSRIFLSKISIRCYVS